MLLTGVMRISQFLYVLVHAKGWGAANHLAVREKILSEEE